MSFSWFLSKIRGTIWLVRHFPRGLLTNQLRPLIKVDIIKHNCWECLQFSSADWWWVYLHTNDIQARRNRNFIRTFEKKWRYNYLGPLWDSTKSICGIPRLLKISGPLFQYQVILSRKGSIHKVGIVFLIELTAEFRYLYVVCTLYILH